MTAVRLPRPPRRRVVFVLTPLIDVIFLLLIFFMLSSQIAPYSLLPLGRIDSASAQPEPTPTTAPTIAPLAVRVSKGTVDVAGERMAISALGEAVPRFAGNGLADYVLIPTATAEVQDVVSVLEALKNAGGSVTLLSASAP